MKGRSLFLFFSIPSIFFVKKTKRQLLLPPQFLNSNLQLFVILRHNYLLFEQVL